MRLAKLLIILLCLATIIPIACSDTTILNEQVSLDGYNSSKSYHFNLTKGQTVSISLSVAGDGLIEFHILNSTDEQLFDKYDIGTEGLQEQWTVLYSDRFEFVVELTIESLLSECTVGITLKTSGGTDQSQPTNQTGNTYVDENVTIEPFPYGTGKDYYLNLTAQDKISIVILTAGKPESLEIYNSTGGVYFWENVTSLNEEWTAPATDTYDFWFFTTAETSEVRIKLQKAGAGLGMGLDPTLVIIIGAIIAAVVIAFVLLLRIRKRPSATLPPPPPPPPPP